MIGSAKVLAGLHREIGGSWLRWQYRNGAPRPMKMGNIASPWRYDAAAHHTLQSASLRPAAILHYAG
jgi:hypothetical protein